MKTYFALITIMTLGTSFASYGKYNEDMKETTTAHKTKIIQLEEREYKKEGECVEISFLQDLENKYNKINFNEQDNAYMNAIFSHGLNGDKENFSKDLASFVCKKYYSQFKQGTNITFQLDKDALSKGLFMQLLDVDLKQQFKEKKGSELIVSLMEEPTTKIKKKINKGSIFGIGGFDINNSLQNIQNQLIANAFQELEDFVLNKFVPFALEKTEEVVMGCFGKLCGLLDNKKP